MSSWLAPLLNTILIMYEVCQIDGTLPNWYTTTKFGGYWWTCKFIKKKRKKKGLVNHLSHPVFHLEILPMCGLFNRWAHINPQLTCQTGPLHTHLPAVLSLGNLPRLITPFIGSAPFGHGDVVCQAMGWPGSQLWWEVFNESHHSIRWRFRFAPIES